MAIYGKSGTGKTNFGSTMPTPILLVNIREDGTDTILGKPGIDEFRVVEWKDLEELYWYLKEGTKYTSILFDQITNMQDLGMEAVRSRGRKGSKDLFTRKDWGELSGLMKTQIQDFVALRDQYNLCFIGHQRTFDGGEEDDEALDPSVSIRVMPSVGSFLEGAVDTIGNTFIREVYTRKAGSAKKTRQVEYCMRLGPHGYYSTKIRRPVTAGPIPELLIDPSFPKIMDIVSGKPLMKKKSKVIKKRSKS